jgi:hypothetical protein
MKGYSADDHIVAKELVSWQFVNDAVDPAPANGNPIGDYNVARLEVKRPPQRSGFIRVSLKECGKGLLRW